MAGFSFLVEFTLTIHTAECNGVDPSKWLLDASDLRVAKVHGLFEPRNEPRTTYRDYTTQCLTPLERYQINNLKEEVGRVWKPLVREEEEDTWIKSQKKRKKNWWFNLIKHQIVNHARYFPWSVDRYVHLGAHIYQMRCSSVLGSKGS